MQRAKEHMKAFMPLNRHTYEELDDMQTAWCDQFLFRFSKLQDTMGDKIFALVLEMSGEDIKRMTFIDRLHRLEELGVLEKERWMVLRQERNEIAHEYRFNIEEVTESLNRGTVQTFVSREVE
jgi:hypothetical protein